MASIVVGECGHCGDGDVVSVVICSSESSNYPLRSTELLMDAGCCE